MVAGQRNVARAFHGNDGVLLSQNALPDALMPMCALSRKHRTLASCHAGAGVISLMWLGTGTALYYSAALLAIPVFVVGPLAHVLQVLGWYVLHDLALVLYWVSLLQNWPSLWLSWHVSSAELWCRCSSDIPGVACYRNCLG